MAEFAWHVHHDVLIEPLVQPIEDRIAYIKEHKPEQERERRLRLLKPVKGQLPQPVVAAAAVFNAQKACDKAWEAHIKARTACCCDKARETYEKAQEAYDKAWEAYGKALSDNLPAIKALHEQECPDCPWDGQSIFRPSWKRRQE